jgi:serine/threonine-protein kinase
MLDGRGRVRITDFGLAVAGEETPAEGEVSGTPAYMAPEQLLGRGASVRSDLYSLGLVLYEIYTGKRAFDAKTLAELRHKHAEEAPAPPSSVLPGLDAAMERVILRCLEREPGARPSSAMQVASALPGGDPLAAALAAGETPSPEMVAAAGEEGALAPGKAWALLAGGLACVAVLFALAPYATDLGLAPIERTPGSLFDRARDIVRRLGYEAPPADTDGWLARNYDFLSYRFRHVPFPGRIRELASANPGWAVFQYRQSPRPLLPPRPLGLVQTLDPPFEVSGMVSVTLDARGRLLAFRAMPPQVDDAKGPAAEPDWSALFSEAGLDLKTFTPAAPVWLSPSPFDARAGWKGRLPGGGDEVQIVAASYRGKPVYFEVVGPWSRPWQMQELPRTAVARLGSGLFVVLLLSLIVSGVFFARRNIRLGRGDRKGAFRLFVFVLSAGLLAWLFRAHHVADLWGEFNLFTSALGDALVVGGLVWLLYMALEPYVRRRWPDLLISWNRFLSGRFRDPLVRRDVLIGSLLGAGLAVSHFATAALPYFFDIAGRAPMNSFEFTLTLRGPRHLLSALFDFQVKSVLDAMAVLSILFLAHLVVRRKWAAVLATGLVLTPAWGGGESLSFGLAVGVILSTLWLVALLRFGTVAFAFAHLFELMLVLSPLTLDLSRWYAGHGLVFFAIFLVAVAYGFKVSLGGKPAFGAKLDE